MHTWSTGLSLFSRFVRCRNQLSGLFKVRLLNHGSNAPRALFGDVVSIIIFDPCDRFKDELLFYEFRTKGANWPKATEMDVDAAKALAIRMNMEIEASVVMTASVIDVHHSTDVLRMPCRFVSRAVLAPEPLYRARLKTNNPRAWKEMGHMRLDYP